MSNNVILFCLLAFPRYGLTMVKIGLQIKALMESCNALTPEGEDFRWYLKLRCGNCGDSPEHWQYITLTESHPLKGGRGEASCVVKCKLCSRENSIDILEVINVSADCRILAILILGFFSHRKMLSVEKFRFVQS